MEVKRRQIFKFQGKLRRGEEMMKKARKNEQNYISSMNYHDTPDEINLMIPIGGKIKTKSTKVFLKPCSTCKLYGHSCRTSLQCPANPKYKGTIGTYGIFIF